jgi:hypothetical protein
MHIHAVDVLCPTVVCYLTEEEVVESIPRLRNLIERPKNSYFQNQFWDFPEGLNRETEETECNYSMLGSY